MEGTGTRVCDVLYRDLVQELVDAHPLLFKGRRPRSRCDICLGWFTLIDQLCSDIEIVLLAEDVDLDVFEIKEKLGGLRFYHGDDNSDGEKITAIVRHAHLESCKTCMNCGAKVEFSRLSVERRLCEECREKCLAHK
jgi:hypothetical protein